MRSPPARGWPEAEGDAAGARGAFPARAGMARSRPRGCPTRCCVPRPRGDGPDSLEPIDGGAARSPPARGWPAGAHTADRPCQAFPARAGMARRNGRAGVSRPCVPRPRGDGPTHLGWDEPQVVRSPPARGWPAPGGTRARPRPAFPARAGMARDPRGRHGRAGGVPRPRGDGPAAGGPQRATVERSPPARGWPV